MGIAAPVSLDVLETAFALKLLPGKFPCTADRFGLFACLLDGGLLEMLLELHFPKHPFTLKFLLQGTESLFDVVVADADLHVVVTTFLS
jgi:hypothetical protein